MEVKFVIFARKDAVIFCGANYGGQIGINVKEV